VPKEQWNLLPEKVRPLVLCEEDFCRSLRAAGHDPADLSITHESWRRRYDYWKSTKDVDPAHAHISFGVMSDDDADIAVQPQETMWCEVLEEPQPGMCVIRLWNTSLYDPRFKKGTLMQVDGPSQEIVHGRTGRPLFGPFEYKAAAKMILHKGQRKQRPSHAQGQSRKGRSRVAKADTR
jgi:hypothetical protein